MLTQKLIDQSIPPSRWRAGSFKERKREMSESKFKTMRHIETVRNYIGIVIKELLFRAEEHDQSKLESPEVEIFEVYTPKLRDSVYGSDEYKKYMAEMKPAIEHHNLMNRHHPEHFGEGFSEMNLIDLVEMLCDWKAATLRHNTGDIRKSLEINQKRFGYSDDVKKLLSNTVEWLEEQPVHHKANES